jgi:hypothetical protein
LFNEISKENDRNATIQFNEIDALKNGTISKEVLTALEDYLNELNDFYIEQYNKYNDEKDQQLIQLNKTDEDKAEFIALKDNYTNESLENLVTNKNDLEKIIEWNNELIQRADPIYKDPVGFRAHFLAPSKKMFGSYVTTFSANLLVIWGFSIFLAITLYFDALRKLLESLGKIIKIKKKS